jgi:hypothetical protein
MKYNKSYFFVYFIAIFVCCFFQNRLLHAEDGSLSEKKRVAVLEINTNNVPASYGNIARNSFEVFLFNSKKFQMLDRERQQAVALKLGISPSSSNSMEDLLKLGKNLSADFLVSGTIDKLDSYKITVRVISVSTGDIISVNSQSFSSIETFDATLDIVTDKITRNVIEYIQTGKVQKSFFEQHDLCAGMRFMYLMPVSNLKNLINAGPGIDGTCELNNIIFNNAYTGLHVEYFWFNGNINHSDQARFTMFFLSFGYKYNFLKWLYVKGEMDGGVNLVTLKHDTGKGFNMKENSREKSVDPLAEGGLFVGINPIYAINIEAGLQYGINFESGGNLNFFNLSLGLSATF